MASLGGIHSAAKAETPSPGLFDVFYEELLTQLMESGELQENIPEEFMSLQTDLQRVEYLMQLRPLVRDLKIKTKSNLKSLEKSTKYREEGNKLFQHEQTAQAILCYNKSLSFAPHPTVEEYLHPEPEANERHTQVSCRTFELLVEVLLCSYSRFTLRARASRRTTRGTAGPSPARRRRRVIVNLSSVCSRRLCMTRNTIRRTSLRPCPCVMPTGQQHCEDFVSTKIV